MKKILIVPFILLLTLAGCTKKQVFNQSEILIGTVVNVTVLGKTKQEVQPAIKAVFEEVKRVDLLMGYGETSVIDDINKASANQPVSIDKESYELIKRSVKFSELSEGGFDITFASAGNLWDFNKTPFTIPSQQEIEESIRHIGYDKLILDDSNMSITKTDSNVKIGLGAIAKGYIVDRGVEALKAAGVNTGIVDAGGDIRVLGKNNGKKWIAGVRHPRKKNAIAMTIQLEDGQACATSGDYERMIETSDGKRYHHIIDPRTGYPTETFSSVTVIADNATDADAFATSFFVMGISFSIEYASMNDIDVIFIDRNMNTYASKSLKNKIEVIDSDINVEWLDPIK
jgi:thiamine biosynthesis lipoprotein